MPIGIDTGYVPQLYPKVMYCKDGRTGLAQNPEHEKTMKGSNWSDKPWPAPMPAKPLTDGEISILKSKVDVLLAENADLKRKLAAAAPAEPVAAATAKK